MEKKVSLMMLGFLLLGAAVLFAGEPAKNENVFKQTALIEGRGFLNFATTPGELAYAFGPEIKNHPKAWPATYVPRVLTNAATRVVSSVYDVFLLPWYAAVNKDSTPLTRHFDMPDYVWQKE